MRSKGLQRCSPFLCLLLGKPYFLLYINFLSYNFVFSQESCIFASVVVHGYKRKYLSQVVKRQSLSEPRSHELRGFFMPYNVLRVLRFDARVAIPKNSKNELLFYLVGWVNSARCNDVLLSTSQKMQSWYHSEQCRSLFFGYYIQNNRYDKLV